MQRIHRLTIPAILLFVLGAPQSASAHEKWFYKGPEKPLRWDLLFQPLPLTFLIGTLALAAVAAFAWRLRGHRDLVPGPEILGATEESRMLFYRWVPAILGLHLAVPLLIYGVQGQMFSPNLRLPSPWPYWLGLIQTGLALAFFYGGMTRPAAVILALLWFVGIGVLGLEPMLENIHYLGYAGFFYLAGRGPYSVDRYLFPKLEPSYAQTKYALIPLRIGVGLSLTIVGFTEKLANLPLAESFLQQEPLNFTAWLGIPMTDRMFALCAGSVEVLVGLLILFGIFPRTIILIAWVPINQSLTVFNWAELVGHLPFYGAFAVLLIQTANPPDRERWVRGLKPEGPHQGEG